MKRPLFRFPWRKRRDISTDVDTELGFHLDARTEELVAAGLSRDAARSKALHEFGDLEDARRYMNASDRKSAARARRKDYMEDLGQDVAYALRTLRRAPAFTLAAVITLALGIGANTAIFSVVNAVVLRDLPFPEPERLVAIRLTNPENGERRPLVPAVDIDDWRARQSAFVDLGGYFYQEGMSGTDLTGAGSPERLSIAAVSPGFFAALGVAPAEGRLPRDAEMTRGGPDKVVMLAHNFWQNRFGGDRSIVRATITLGGEPYRVLGVMPAAFSFPDARVQAWIPYSTIPDRSIPRIRGLATLSVVGRLKQGVTIDQGAADMSKVTSGLATEFPQTNRTWSRATLVPLQESVAGAVRGNLFVLLGAVAFLMLMACVNVAGLLLARASTREREIVVRVALGAGRGRMVRQMLTESVVLALAGGIAGVLLANAGLGGLLALAGDKLPRSNEVRLDAGVLTFALGLSVATGLLFGLVPAVRASSPQLGQHLREGGRGTIGGATRLRSGLVVVQVALAAMLVVGAGLMTKSFARLLDVERGFNSHKLIAVMFSISTDRHPQYPAFQKQVVDLVRTLPGISAAAAARDAPFRGGGEQWSFLPEGMVLGDGEGRPGTNAMFISDGYVKTIGARMVEGREFTADDRPPTPAGTSVSPPPANAPPIPVLVNETLAKRFFPNGSAIDKTMRIGNGTVRIIGVVADVRQVTMEDNPPPFVFVHNQYQSRVKTTILARVSGDPMTAGRAIRDAVWTLDRDQTITSIFTVDEAASGAVARPRLLTVLLGGFGALGLILGAVGIYGMLAYLVSQRQREIGIRIALGAAPTSVTRMVVGRGLALTAIGIGIGLAGALGLGRFFAGVLYGVEPGDPATLASVVGVLTAVATLAAWIPARRGSRVDPAVTLRAE